MSKILPEMTVGIARDADGDLYIPARQVTDLLRRLAGQWNDWTADEVEPRLDEPTVQVLAGALDELADQLDVECIAHTHQHHDGHPHEEGGER